METNTQECEFSDKIIGIKTEFRNRIQIARQEIQTKFGGYFDELRKEEARLLEKLNGIETETIKEFELSSKTLTEITHAREQVLATLKSNTTNFLLKNTLVMYDKEIETIKNKSKQNLPSIHLQWNTDNFEVKNICKLTLVPNEKVKEEPITLDTKYLKPRTVAVVSQFEDIAPLRFDSLHFEDSLNIHNPSLFGNNSNCNSNSNTQLADGTIKPCSTKQNVTSRVIQPFVVQEKVESRFWQCQYCTVLNPIRYSICEVCERNKDS